MQDGCLWEKIETVTSSRVARVCLSWILSYFIIFSEIFFFFFRLLSDEKKMQLTIILFYQPFALIGKVTFKYNFAPGWHFNGYSPWFYIH